MHDQPSTGKDEADLGELMSCLWSHKVFIAFITGLSVFLAINFTITAEKKFIATSIFKIQDGSSNGFSVSSELGALASLVGMGSVKSTNSESLIERMMGREFILNVNKGVSLETDSFFNTYDPNKIDPKWKAFLKYILGWQLGQVEKNAIVEKNIIKNYKKFVAISLTDADSISISVKHKSGQAAAKYANFLMEAARKLIEFENEKETERRLSYLSETLADALVDVEKSQQNLKEYALKNSALAQENFISGSLKLDELRMEQREAQEILNVLTVIQKLVEKDDLNIKSYELLRANYPLVDDVKFRRILGMSETISAWSWPESETIKAVSATLKDRIKRLDVEIENIENNAKIYASSAEDLAKLTREAKIAEATYTVLIEQVKSQTLTAGFKPDTFKVFAYAAVPLRPSSPNGFIILALGTVLGLFIGCSIALLNSMRRGVYYTKSLLIEDSSPATILYSKPLLRISRLGLSGILSQISEKRLIELDEALIKLARQKLIYVINSGGRPTADGITRLLAAKSAISGRKVMLCDTSGLSSDENSKLTLKTLSGMSFTSTDGGPDVLQEFDINKGVSFFTSSDFTNNMEKLIQSYDQIFVCCRTKEAVAGLLALKPFNPSVILLARLRKTRKNEVQNIKSIKEIGILMHD